MDERRQTVQEQRPLVSIDLHYAPQHGEVASLAKLILIVTVSNDWRGRRLGNQGCGTGQNQSARAVGD